MKHERFINFAESLVTLYLSIAKIVGIIATCILIVLCICVNGPTSGAGIISIVYSVFCLFVYVVWIAAYLCL